MGVPLEPSSRSIIQVGLFFVLFEVLIELVGERDLFKRFPASSLADADLE